MKSGEHIFVCQMSQVVLCKQVSLCVCVSAQTVIVTDFSFAAVGSVEIHEIHFSHVIRSSQSKRPNNADEQPKTEESLQHHFCQFSFIRCND